MRYELADCEWPALKPMLPNKPRGVPRVNDRRVLNGNSRSCDPEHRGAICRRASGRRPSRALVVTLTNHLPSEALSHVRWRATQLTRSQG
jgi:transposase